MRILLDNCVKKELRACFVGHEVRHCAEVGWSALKNGDLLRQADARFDLLVTIDKNMRFQSSLKGRTLRVAILDVRGNLIEQLIPAADRLVEALDALPLGEFTVVRIGV